jgi:hypothetical protein
MGYVSGTKDEIIAKLKAENLILDDKLEKFFDREVPIIETFLNKFLKSEFLAAQYDVYRYASYFYPICRQLYQNFDILSRIKVVIDVEKLKQAVLRFIEIKTRLSALFDAERKPVVEFGEKRYILIKKGKKYSFMDFVDELEFRGEKYDLDKKLRALTEIILKEISTLVTMKDVLDDRVRGIFLERPEMGKREYGELSGIEFFE